MSIETKPNGYFGNTRPEMLDFVPKSARRILDVGCGNGAYGAALRHTMPGAEVWGVEPDADAQNAAAKVLDRVFAGFFDERLGLDDEQFDAIVFNDSLEHFPDHVAPLRLAHRLLRPGGSLVASIPNVRYWPHLRRYLFGGEWRYESAGILDRTHLRFFTYRSIVRTLDETGFNLARIEGINPCWRGVRLAVSRNLLPSSMRDVLYLQFAVTAVRRGEPAASLP